MSKPKPSAFLTRFYTQQSIFQVSSESMSAFVDALLVIILTIQVLDLKVPIVPINHLADALLAMWPSFLVYFLSFLFLTTYWQFARAFVNTVHHFDRYSTWLFLFYLFFITLIPFSTALLDRYIGQSIPGILFGLNLICISIMFSICHIYTYVHKHQHESHQQNYLVILGFTLSMVFLILLSIVVSIFFPWWGFFLYIFFSIIYLPFFDKLRIPLFYLFTRYILRFPI